MPCSGRTQRRLSVEARRRPSASTWARGRRGRSRGSPRRARRRWRGRASRSPRTARRRARPAARGVRPVLRRKPSSACGGASARGPLRFLADRLRSRRAGRARSARGGAGSAKVSIASAARPALASSAANSRARSSRALSCIRAGISSERSSRRKSVICVLPGRSGAARSRAIARDAPCERELAGPSPRGEDGVARPSRRPPVLVHPRLRTRPSRDRGRGRYRPARSATEITPRACSRLKTWLALIACS